MQTGIAHIKKELTGTYPDSEIQSFIFLIFQFLRSYTRTQFLLNKEEHLSEEEYKKVIAITNRLKQHEPIQYILGETEFFGLKFHCRPKALIPRPETEELVDWIICDKQSENARILDIGTGTGCIPITLKYELPNAKLQGCDLSDECLQLAHENAQQNQTDVSFFKMDILHPEETKGLHSFDIIVSNPPYVCDNEKQQMEANVLNYEPELALFVPDDDPLRFYKAILQFSKQHLSPDGKIYWEINEALGNECICLLKEYNFRNIHLRKDLNGKDRMLSAQKG